MPVTKKFIDPISTTVTDSDNNAAGMVVPTNTTTNNANTTTNSTNANTNTAPGKRTTVNGNSGSNSGDNSESQTYTATDGDELITQIQDRINAMEKPMSKEDLRKLRKRQAARQIVAGVADVSGAIANMIAASRYAPAAEGANNLSERMKARFDKEKADREAKDELYYNLNLQLANAKAAKQDRDFKQSMAEEDLKLKQEKSLRDELKAQLDANLAELKMQVLLGKMSQAEAEARAANAKAEYAERYWQSIINRNNRSGGSGGGGKGRYYGTLNGVRYPTKADYDKALADLADEHNIPTTEETKTEHTRPDGLNVTSKGSRARKPGAIAHDAEKAAQKKQEKAATQTSEKKRKHAQL